MATPPFKPTSPAKPASPALQQRSGAALMLAMLSLIGLILLSSGNARRGVVVLVVTLVIGGAGLWLAITAMSRARKAGGARPRFAVLATVLSSLGTGLSVLVLIGFAMFWTQINQYENCMAGANTVTAQNECSQQLNNSLHDSVHMFGN